jgi:hypothetical protein
MGGSKDGYSMTRIDFIDYRGLRNSTMLGGVPIHSLTPNMLMKIHRSLAAVSFSFFIGGLSFAALTPEEVNALWPSAVEKQLPAAHPSAYYSYAQRLFNEGKKDEAVLWLYVGQIRYRVHLKANPKLDPSGDPALFASLSGTVGRQINEYAGGDAKMWLVQIDKALEWDDRNPNNFTSKKKFSKEYQEIRAGLVSMRQGLEKNLDQLREQRKKAGLANRS